MSNVDSIKIQLKELFGSHDTTEVSRDSKGRLNVKYLCPYRMCNTKEHELKRHLMRKKHGWTEEDAAMHTSFTSRMFNYVTRVNKYFISKPNLCVKCNIFFDRIDQHMKNVHSLESGSEEYKSLRSECTTETLTLMNMRYDKDLFKFRPIKKLTPDQFQIDNENQPSHSKQKSSHHTVTLPPKRTEAEKVLTEEPLATLSTAIPADSNKSNTDAKQIQVSKFKRKVTGSP